MDPLWHAMSKLRRGKLEECIALCDEMLSQNPGDQVWSFPFHTYPKHIFDEYIDFYALLKLYSGCLDSKM